MVEYSEPGDKLEGIRVTAQHRNIQPKKRPKEINGKKQFILHDFVVCTIEKSFRAKNI
jgi:hypothetical protein